MLTPTRIYVSVPNDSRLPGEQLDIKKGIFQEMRSAGFEPQELVATGEFANIPWSFENVQYKLSRCQGAAVLGLVRWDVRDAENRYRFNTAYNHYEGALALARHLPTLVLMHEKVHKAGIVLKGRAPYFVKLPDGVDSAWLQTDRFLSTFRRWVDAVRKRRHIFMGYGKRAEATAVKIKNFLTGKGVSVMDRAADFDPAAAPLDELERASNSCMASIFLFTAEDGNLTEDQSQGSLTDHLRFEAGYFLHAKGRDKTLVIMEAGAPIPVEMVGVPCLSLHNLEDSSAIEKSLEEFITKNL
jgi:hypothetical protein